MSNNNNNQHGGQVQLPNPHLESMPTDYLFHLHVPLDNQQVMDSFKEVKFVCIGGTADRMKNLALQLAKAIGRAIPDGQTTPFDYSFENERYAGYKVGPIFCINHGIGTPSLSIMLHEVFKLLQKAQCSDVTIIRVGTCGGIGEEAGTVVVSTGALTAGMEPVFVTSSLGEPLKLPTYVDQELVTSIVNCREADDTFNVVTGKTYCAEDFYQGQGRLDGSFCDYDKEAQKNFLTRLKNNGVRNIEMESAGVLGLCHRVGIKAAVVCVVLVDRLESELPTLSTEKLHEIQDSPITLVSRYIKRQLDSDRNGSI